MRVFVLSVFFTINNIMLNIILNPGSLWLFLSSPLWIWVFLLLFTSAAKKKPSFQTDRLTETLPRTAADLHNIATQHRVAGHTVVVHHSSATAVGAPGPVHMCRGHSGQMELRSDRNVRSPAGCFRPGCQREIPHPAESHLQGEPQLCADQRRLRRGENVEFIWPSGAVSSWGRRKYVGVGTGAGGEGTIKHITESWMSFEQQQERQNESYFHISVDVSYLSLMLDLSANINFCCLRVLREILWLCNKSMSQTHSLILL